MTDSLFWLVGVAAVVRDIFMFPVKKLVVKEKYKGKTKNCKAELG